MKIRLAAHAKSNASDRRRLIVLVNVFSLDQAEVKADESKLAEVCCFDWMAYERLGSQYDRRNLVVPESFQSQMRTPHGFLDALAMP